MRKLLNFIIPKILFLNHKYRDVTEDVLLSDTYFFFYYGFFSLILIMVGFIWIS